MKSATIIPPAILAGSAHQQSAGEIFRENISQAALELAENLLETTQCDALVALLQTVESGRRESQLSGKLRVGQITTPLFEEAGKLTFQRLWHAATLENLSFRMRNIFRNELVSRLRVSHHPLNLLIALEEF